MKSVWDYKPWWCQPWSILLTGLVLISGSWLMFHRFWVTGLVAAPLSAWMGFFLLLYPRMVLLPAEPDANLQIPTDAPR
jgi:hypothetical protein